MVFMVSDSKDMSAFAWMPFGLSGDISEYLCGWGKNTGFSHVRLNNCIIWHTDERILIRLLEIY